MKKTLLAFVCVAFTMFATYAQNDVTVKPYSFNHSNVSMIVDKIDLPAVDVDKLLAEDAAAEKGTPYRVGYTHNVDYNFQNSGRTDVLDDGSRLWRLSLSSPGAIMMSVVFSQFNIPEGATMYVYNADRSQFDGPFTNEDYLQLNGYMTTLALEGDEIILEYHEPADVPFHGEVTVARVSHMYKDLFHVKDEEKGYWGDAEGDCHYDVACSIADPWHDQIYSVVCISITNSTGSYRCSGAMINNVRQDKTPYVFSANHCSTVSDDAYIFVFEYQKNSCNGTSGPYYKLARNGVKVASSGYTGENYNLGSSSDFLLLRITGDLPNDVLSKLVFAGWDAGGSSSTGATIHHPGGDYKKISFPRIVASPGGSYNKFWTVGWYYGQFGANKGCTEPGSSGSPLFNASGLIIGSLSNGSSACDAPQGTDNYGKISYSWTNNNNSNNTRKLQPWLDPDNTGALVLRGMHYDGTPAGVESYSSSSSAFTISPNPSIGDITVKGSFPMGNGICNVYNSMGMLVQSQNVLTDNVFNLHFDGLSDGIYFLEIVCDKHIYQSKMLIAR